MNRKARMTELEGIIEGHQKELDGLLMLESRRKEEERERRNVALKRMKDNPESWEWLVKEDTYRPFHGDLVQHGVRLSRRLNSEVIAEFVKVWGPLSEDELRAQGMFYWRTEEGILTQDGGGTYVLKTPSLCSDEEWEEILHGNPPEKLQR